MIQQTSNNGSSFTIEAQPGYVHIKYVGALREGDLRESTRLAAEKAKELGVGVLNDIRYLAKESVTIGFQSEAFVQLWKHRAVKKIAVLYDDDTIGNLVRSTFGLVVFVVNCKVFDDETEAIQWLQEN